MLFHIRRDLTEHFLHPQGFARRANHDFWISVQHEITNLFSFYDRAIDALTRFELVLQQHEEHPFSGASTLLLIREAADVLVQERRKCITELSYFQSSFASLVAELKW
jgi:hypothetical protein